jgi:hypothetical protein
MSQSILGRVFDYGTLTIRGTGETIEALRNIASPFIRSRLRPSIRLVLA